MWRCVDSRRQTVINFPQAPSPCPKLRPVSHPPSAFLSPTSASASQPPSSFPNSHYYHLPTSNEKIFISNKRKNHPSRQFAQNQTLETSNHQVTRNQKLRPQANRRPRQKRNNNPLAKTGTSESPIPDMAVRKDSNSRVPGFRG